MAKKFEIDALYEGNNPRSLKFVAEETGDPGIYQEIRMGAFLPNGTCVADALMTLDKEGHVRFLLTADGDGDGDHKACHYPENPIETVNELDLLRSQLEEARESIVSLGIKNFKLERYKEAVNDALEANSLGSAEDKPEAELLKLMTLASKG